jgi:hypothetical protein
MTFDQSDPIALTAAEQHFGHAAHDYAVTYDRYVNKHGVPVRRLVLTGPEEVDNAAVQAAA